MFNKYLLIITILSGVILSGCDNSTPVSKKSSNQIRYLCKVHIYGAQNIAKKNKISAIIKICAV